MNSVPSLMLRKPQRHGHRVGEHVVLGEKSFQSKPQKCLVAELCLPPLQSAQTIYELQSDMRLRLTDVWPWASTLPTYVRNCVDINETEELLFTLGQIKACLGQKSGDSRDAAMQRNRF